MVLRPLRERISWRASATVPANRETLATGIPRGRDRCSWKRGFGSAKAVDTRGNGGFGKSPQALSWWRERGPHCLCACAHDTVATIAPMANGPCERVGPMLALVRKNVFRLSSGVSRRVTQFGGELGQGRG